MNKYRYELKLKKSREKVDLRRSADRIAAAVHHGVGGKKVHVKVAKDYYEYMITDSVTRGELIKIGKNIAKSCSELHKYGYLYKPKIGKPILQLFRRVKGVK